ncbi:hypothetical protein NL501_28475, partial [Klebsiella pneumoniae]|nr:hypothetical protein [Klebsiella pneumoniae]
EVPASGIFRIDLKSAAMSRCVILKVYPWKYICKESVTEECANNLTQISADLPTFVSVVTSEAKLYLAKSIVPLNMMLPQVPLETRRRNSS